MHTRLNFHESLFSGKPHLPLFRLVVTALHLAVDPLLSHGPLWLLPNEIVDGGRRQFPIN